MYSVYANRVPALIATFLILTSLFFTHTSRAEEPAKKATPPDKTEKKEQTKADPLSVACKKIDDTRKKTCGDLKKLGDDLKKEFEQNKKLKQTDPTYIKAIDDYARKKDAFDRGVEKAKDGVPKDRRPHTTDLGCDKKAILSGKDADCAKTSDAKDAKSGIRGRNAIDIKSQGKTVGAEFCEVKNGLYTGDVRKESTSTPYSYVAVIKGKSGFTTQNKQFCLDQERIVTNAGKNCAACAKGASLWNPALGDLAPGVATCGTSKVSGIKEAVPIVCRENYEKAIADAAKKKLEQDAFDSKDFNPYSRPKFVEEPKVEKKTPEAPTSGDPKTAPVCAAGSVRDGDNCVKSGSTAAAPPVDDPSKDKDAAKENLTGGYSSKGALLPPEVRAVTLSECAGSNSGSASCIARVRQLFAPGSPYVGMTDAEIRAVVGAGGQLYSNGLITAPRMEYGRTYRYSPGDNYLVTYDEAAQQLRAVDVRPGHTYRSSIRSYVMPRGLTPQMFQDAARCGFPECN